MTQMLVRSALLILLLCPVHLFSAPPYQTQYRPKEPIYCKYANEIVREFAKEMKDMYGLSCTGDGGGFVGGVNSVSLSFVLYHPATIDQAREILILVNQDLLEKIQKHKKIQPHLKETPFPINRAEVSIGFRNPDGSARKDVEVVHVFQVDNKVYFYGKDFKRGERVKIQEEPYEEALRIVKDSQKTPTSEK